MKKPVKICLWILAIPLILIVLVIGALAAHPIWLGKVVKSVADKQVPKLTQTGFELGYCDINLYDGALAVGNIRLDNPEGFDERCAAKLGEVKVAVNMDSLSGDVVEIREVILRDIFVSYVDNDGENNFDVIGENVKSATATADAGEPVDGEMEIEEREPTASEDGAEAVGDGGAKPEKKVVIDHLVISGVSVKYGFLTIPVPIDIELFDLGKEEQGITWAEAGREIVAAVMKSLGMVGDGIKSLGSGALDAADGAYGVTTNALAVGESVLETGIETVESVKELGEEFKEVGKEFKAVGKEFENLGKGFKDMFKGKKNK